MTGRCVDWKMKFCYYTNRCVINRTSAFLVIHDYRCIVNHRKLDRNFQIIVQFVYNFIARVFPLYFIKNSKFFIIKLGFFLSFLFNYFSFNIDFIHIYKSVFNILKIEKRERKEKRKRGHQSVILFHRDKEFEIWSTRGEKLSRKRMENVEIRVSLNLLPGR